MGARDLFGRLDAALAGTTLRATVPLSLILLAALVGIWRTRRLANRVGSMDGGRGRGARGV